ncbi:MAG: transglycosylase SLT domain-containing protein [Bryobacteraceae bacterium]|jgi:membrane-bound lytic murein transglycosylase D
MAIRTKAIFALAVAAALTSVGCGYQQQQSKFQMAFLPPAPHTAPAVAEFADPPSVSQPNLFLKDVPAFPLVAPGTSDRKLAADALVQRAGRLFERGKYDFQRRDIASSRREFDAAVDLMLEASTENPAGSPVYAHLLEGMVDEIHRRDLAGMGASAVDEDQFEKAPLEDILEMTFPVDPRLKDKVREQVAATVSQLPLSVNDAVLGYINYFSNRGRRTLINGLERAGRYRPMIQRVLDEEGVPRELIHLAQAESGFIPRAVSRKAAGGMWQFLAWRGQEYGLNRTPYLDERMDPEKATRAAARHLRDLYQEFGDWYLALAAYNCGPVTVEKAVERTGYADFWELRNRGVLPLETTNYVPIILAMTIMDKNAAEYGIQDLQPDPALEYDTVEIAAPTSMTLVSDITEVSLPELAALNPSILKRVAPAGYALHVPKGAGDALIPALESIPPEHREAWRMHRVGPGETLAEIGKRYGVAVNGIVALNNLPSTETVEGDRLVIPAALRAEQPERRVASSPSKKAPARRQASTRNSATTASRKNGPASGKSSAQAAKRSASAPAKKAASKPSLTATASSPEPRALVAETGTR